MNRPIAPLVRTRLAAVGIALALVSLGACKEPSGNAPQKVTTVNVAPDSLRMFVNTSFQLVVTPLDQSGKTVENKNPIFKSDDISIASVSTTGLVIALREGVTNITATVDGKDGKAKIVVARVTIAQIQIDPPGGQVLAVGSSVDLRARPVDQQGTTLGDRTVNWSSSNPALVSVTSTGPQTAHVTALSGGTATITAESEGKTANVSIGVPSIARISLTPSGPQVLRAGGTLQLAATPVDAQGNTIPNRPQTWTSSVPQVATVNPTTGKITAIQPGNTTVTVTIDNSTQSVPIAVTLVPLTKITVAPNAFSLFETASRQLTITGTDSTGATITDFSQRSLNVLRSSDVTVATVNGSLVVNGVSPGQATVFITISTPGANDQVSTQSDVDVRRRNTAIVVVNATTVTLAVGTTSGALTAVAQDSVGTTLPNRPAEWTSSDESIATVTKISATSAVVNGLKAGSVTVTAKIDDKTSIPIQVKVQ